MGSGIGLERLSRAKRGFTTRRVPAADMHEVVDVAAPPQPGDLVFARVERLGFRAVLERPDGREARLYRGDEIVVCYGNHQAPANFEAVVPDNMGPCDLVDTGGIAAKALSWHQDVNAPTSITPLGVIRDPSGRRLNIGSYAAPARPLERSVPVVAVVGASAGSGSTTVAAALIRGLCAHGERAAGMKVTGAGSGRDLWELTDAGASVVFDVVDAGFPSTYETDVGDIVQSAQSLVAHAARARCSAVVMELSGGLTQSETAEVLRAEALRAMVDGVIFACTNAIEASAGSAWLREAEYRVLALSGRISRSPLAMRAAEAGTGLACYPAGDLQRDEVAGSLLVGRSEGAPPVQ